ncbi:hypothetical protein CWN71_17835 [Klebsiella pneumoniae]|nr:hypothetical protein CWN71_17835 [Klebsiella pneumoniae]
MRILRAAIQHVETSDSCNAQRGSHAYPYTANIDLFTGVPPLLLLIQFCNRSREGANQIADEKCENSLQIKGIQRIPSGISAVSAEEPGGALRARLRVATAISAASGAGE